MKGNAKLIDALNALLADKLTAANQSIVHSEMCENWGYDKLRDIHIGPEVPKMLDNDHHAEEDAIGACSQATGCAA